MFAVLFLFSLLVAQNTAQIVGFWYWTWGSGQRQSPSGTNRGFAFDGTFASTALTNSEQVRGALPGTKILTVGGGGTRWTQAQITATVNALASIKQKYAGIAWDIEEGEAGLHFASAFAAVKRVGLENWVTVSHSTPYGITDTARLMLEILADSNVDYISPQLYTTGTEPTADFTTANGVAWTAYLTAKAKIVPSIPSGSMYQAVYCYFKNIGITLGGYVQWQQSGFTGPAPTTPSCSTSAPTTPTTTNGCGTTWATASCSAKCPKGTNAECPQGQYCYANVACSVVLPPSVAPTFNGCGKSWDEAVQLSCSAVKCPKGLDSECPSGARCYAGVPCSTAAANQAVIVSETKNPDGTTTTTTTITTSDSIPGYGVALLCIAALVIVVLVVLIALVSTKKQTERV